MKISRRTGALLILGLVTLYLVGSVSAAVSTATSIICDVLTKIRTVLYMIAGAIAAVIITLQGIKWAASADDPGARKQAKEGIIHAIVGLIIVLLAVALVSMVFTGACT